MNKKVLILISLAVGVFVVILAAAGLIFYFFFYQTERAKIKGREETGEVSDSADFSILEAKEIPFGEEYSYEIGTAEFVVYPPDLENYQFGYFEVYNRGEKIYASAPLYMVLDILAFEYQGNKYVILSDYSGGAHCCFRDYIFYLTEDDELKFMGSLDLGETHILEESLLVKGKNLYLKIFDDRFAYFYTPYVNSYFFPQYLKVEGDQLTISNTDFQEDYLEQALGCENDLEEKLAEQKTKEFENYSPLLVCITANYLLAGQEKKAWQKFEDYSVQVPLDYYGELVNLEQFKQDLINLTEGF